MKTNQFIPVSAHQDVCLPRFRMWVTGTSGDVSEIWQALMHSLADPLHGDIWPGGF